MASDHWPPRPERRGGISALSRHSAEGFTLIELLVVIVVIGVLAAVVIFALGGISASAAISACRADAKTVELAVQSYTTVNGSAPTSPAQLISTSPNYLQSWPSSPYYEVSLQGGSVVVAAPVGTPPRPATSAGVCDGASSSASSSSTTTTPSSSTTPTTTTSSTSSTTTSTTSTTTTSTTSSTTTSTTSTTVPPSGVTVSVSSLTRNYHNNRYYGRDYLRLNSPSSITALDITISVVKPPTTWNTPVLTVHFAGGSYSKNITMSGSDIIYRVVLTSGSIRSGNLDGRVWASFYGNGNSTSHTPSADTWTVDVTTLRGHSVLAGPF